MIGLRSTGTTLSTTTTTPPTHTEQEVGVESMEEEAQNRSHTIIHAHSLYDK